MELTISDRTLLIGSEASYQIVKTRLASDNGSRKCLGFYPEIHQALADYSDKHKDLYELDKTTIEWFYNLKNTITKSFKIDEVFFVEPDNNSFILFRYRINDGNINIDKRKALLYPSKLGMVFKAHYNMILRQSDLKSTDEVIVKINELVELYKKIIKDNF